MAVAIPSLAHDPVGGASAERDKPALGAAAGRLIVVSNRVPVPAGAGSPNAGGLAVALDAALKQRGGLWFGWSGNTVDGREPETQTHEFGNVSYAVTDLARRDLDDYYHGFANRALWPVCHYRLDMTGFNRRNTAGYFRVNEFFARRLAPLIQPDDVIWIHDYHFIPLASYLRGMGFTNRMGFFLHIPWPPGDLAGVLPAYDLILRGFASYDLVGFQTPLDAETSAKRSPMAAAARLGEGCYEAYGRRFRVGAFPIGIDTQGFRQLAEQGERNGVVRRTAASLEGKALIIGVDRLDYSKGICERIDAFSCFIENNQALRNRVTYLQITPKSRSEVPEYAHLQREVAEQIGETNGRYGDVDWTPIRYINKPIGHTALAGLYRLARVGLVTPLRDGMNLVAKEYVAAQSGDESGRAGALAVCRRRARARRRPAGQSLRHRRDRRRDQARPRHAARRAQGALVRHDGASRAQDGRPIGAATSSGRLAAEEGCPEPASSNGEGLRRTSRTPSRRTPLWDAVKN